MELPKRLTRVRVGSKMRFPFSFLSFLLHLLTLLSPVLPPKGFHYDSILSFPPNSFRFYLFILSLSSHFTPSLVMKRDERDGGKKWEKPEWVETAKQWILWEKEDKKSIMKEKPKGMGNEQEPRAVWFWKGPRVHTSAD